MRYGVWLGLMGALAVAGLAAGAAEPAPGYPQLELANRRVRMKLYLPDATRGYYRGTRFDWSGMIAQAETGGHTFFDEWRTPHRPENHDDVVGPAEEFGQTGALGFSEAKPGETFVKIGVGVLEKTPDPTYSFFTPYRIVQPGRWTVRHGKEWVEFRQDLASGGWGYHYVKRVELLRSAPGFTVSHRLKNTGARAIVTDHYAHNFTLIDGDRIGTRYRLTLPFEATPKEPNRLGDVAEVRGHKILFHRDIEPGKDLFVALGGVRGETRENGVLIQNLRTGAALDIRGDTPISKFSFYAAPTAVCPEPFIPIDLKPGAEQQWRTVYLLKTNG
jgi:hypothetical protein